MLDQYTPHQNGWQALPPPLDKNWEFGQQPGRYVDDINPVTLTYWHPINLDMKGTGAFFSFMGALISLAALLLVILLPGLRDFLSDAITWAVGLSVVFLLFCLYSLNRNLKGPLLPPPVIFNRKTQQVMYYTNDRGRRGEWVVMDWHTITAATQTETRRHRYGSFAYESLRLMRLTPGNPRITHAARLHFMDADHGVYLQTWEFIRRYMNDAPDQVPLAEVSVKSTDKKIWAVRMQYWAYPGLLDDQGQMKWQVDNVIMFSMMFFVNIGLYPTAWFTALVASRSPRLTMPAELAQANAWDERQAHDYQTKPMLRGMFGDQCDPAVAYDHVKLRHVVMSLLTLSLYGGALIGLMFLLWPVIKSS